MASVVRIAAMIFNLPPHMEQLSISIRQTRFRSIAHELRNRADDALAPRFLAYETGDSAEGYGVFWAMTA